MSRLTVTEKEHWKTRIERKIDKAIDTLSHQDPALLSSVKESAKQKAYNSLGIADDKATIDELEQNIKTLEDQKSELENTIYVRTVGKPTNGYGSFHRAGQIDRVVAQRQTIHEEELLAQSEIGKQVLSLRQEKEELLDTVWLATSSVQIRELWTRVAELLDETPTDLQQKAVAIGSDIE